MDTGTSCPVCIGVAAGGRIRLTDLSADMLLDLLDAHRKTVTKDRRWAIEVGNAESIKNYDDDLKRIDMTVAEIERTQREMGWADGQPQRSHS